MCPLQIVPDLANRCQHESGRNPIMPENSRNLKLKPLSPTKTVVDAKLRGGISGICAAGGQQDIYLTAAASAHCLELTMSVVMGINNADPWPDKSSLPPRLSSQHRGVSGALIKSLIVLQQVPGDSSILRVSKRPMRTCLQSQ
ncbi:unnamed protein product [Pleuronectes platessa]|uniref:Uncharacterized protein n=1 Tax=Pleuronectes platessa TaxID=8262 RepID=A0A9N7VGZ8_PLEPL|nr:unnamed protein product [Pleuronectes platessa]